MRTARAPLRFSLGGGGSDLPGYAQKHGGFIVAAAIDSHVSVTVQRRRGRPGSGQHDAIAREALRLLDIDSAAIDSDSAIEPGSGLGSSSSFTVALLAALHASRGAYPAAVALAEQACTIEIDRLGAPIGKQDQYMAALGGVQALTFDKSGAVQAEVMPAGDLGERLLVFDSGLRRSTSIVLAGGVDETHMHRIKALGREVYRLLKAGDTAGYGELLHEHWQHKRNLASTVTTPTIDAHYRAARDAGAVGGKLMGAGGGGFFMFFVPPGAQRDVSEAMAARGLSPLPFRFDSRGVRVV